MSIDTAYGSATRHPVARFFAWRRAWLAMDKNDRAIAFAATPAGVLAIHAGFLLTLAVSLDLSAGLLAMTAMALAGCALWPARRKLVIAGAGLAYVTLRPFRIEEWSQTVESLATAVPLPPVALQSAAVALFLAIAWIALETQRRFAHTGIAKRPVRAMLVLFFATVAAAATLSQGSLAHTGLWSFIGVWASCFWFFAYALVDQKTGDPSANYQRLGMMRPFWSGSATPIGKNFGYLSKFEAHDPSELAVTRLKALKLVVWAGILNGIYFLAAHVIHGAAAVPTLQEAILLQAGGQEASLGVRWTSLLSNYFLDLLLISVWGHAIVAVVRMVGYRIPRNTWNPMASRSISEFWNRYFFYFKELLVDFFFYPAFLRFFKKQPRLRIAFATLCAAGFGNFLYHFMRETYVFAYTPNVETLPKFYNAGFYSLVLATGLIVSQLRGHRPKPEDGFYAYHVRPRLGVMAFFCLLKIFDDITGVGTLGERFAFLFRLFGV
ncbi:hypothetical protein [Nitratireductor sp. XY-223]|uniref:hypothetical protein n=1 Tax=Nitratireductor sp. XY-223 TaxID=2561926 RepID=UPI0010AACF70|nr:hypothetical protein [Nitratireductor sp. XY-223]